MVDRRVRRPSDKEDVLKTLVDEGPFRAMRDVLLFAAALGYAERRRVGFTQSGEPLRWDVLAHRQSSEHLVNMIAVAATNDLEVLRSERFGERVTVMEEYANGGLEILRERLERSSRPPIDTIVDLLLEYDKTTEAEESLDLVEIASDLTW